MFKIYCPSCKAEIIDKIMLEGITAEKGQHRVCICEKCNHSFLAYEGITT